MKRTRNANPHFWSGPGLQSCHHQIDLNFWVLDCRAVITIVETASGLWIHGYSVSTAGPQPGTVRPQWAPLDLNLGPSELSEHRWTSTWDSPSSVSTAGPQRPDRLPEDMPDRTPDRMSERMPEDMPDKVPECLPDRMPEDMPDRMSDRMPEGMPDKVPECLPEHMPEDLPDRMPDRMS